jgi:hypothetical protein
MEKEFLPYQESLELKELGFNEKCAAHYLDEDDLELKWKIYRNLSINMTYLVQAPLYQQAFRWFREKYGLVGWVEGNNGKRIFMYRIESPIDSDDQLNCYPFRTYEEAELACLKKLIEIVKNK